MILEMESVAGSDIIGVDDIRANNGGDTVSYQDGNDLILRKRPGRTRGMSSSLNNIDYIYDPNPTICNQNIFQNNYFIAIISVCIGLFVIILVLALTICILVNQMTKLTVHKVDYEK